MKWMVRLPRTAALLLAWLYFSSPAHAQDATWHGPVITNLWNDASNWTPTIPGATGTATFAAPTTTLMSISTLGGVSVGTLQFNAPNYTFDVPDALAINGTGINASLANAPTFNVIGTPGHSTPRSISITLAPLARRKSFLALQLLKTGSLVSSTRATAIKRLSSTTLVAKSK